MKNLKFIPLRPFALALLLSAHTLPTPAAESSANSPEFKSAVAQLVEVIKPHLVTLDRPMLTFHYQTANAPSSIATSSSFDPQSIEDVKWRISRRPKRFFDPQVVDQTLQGVGVYVATDPSATRSYGGNYPHLFAITIKKGARLLSVTTPGSPEEQAAIRTMAEKFKCQNPSNGTTQSTSLDSVVARFRNSTDVICRQLIIEAMAQTGVEAILYSYSSANSFADCRHRSEALNIVSEKAIDLDRLSFYSQSKHFEGESSFDFISRLYDDGSSDFQLRWAAVDSPGTANRPFAIAARAVTDSNYRNWRESYLYKCGPVWSPEKTPGNIDLMSEMRSAFENSDVADLLIQAKTLYRSRAPGPNSWDYPFEPMNIHLIERMEYRLMALASDNSKFSQFIDAKNTLRNWKLSNEDRSREAGRLLEEPAGTLDYPALQSELMTTMAKLTSEERKSPNLMTFVLLKTGLGARQSLITVNTMAVSSFGGAPFIIKGPSKDLGPASQDAYRANIDVFKKILRECITIYSDQRLTFEQIQAGSCGVRQSPKLQ